MALDFEQLNLNEIQTLLRGWRENNERHSDDVMELWEIMVADNVHRLGKEKHVVLEQMILSALDCHRWDVADKCIGLLLVEFPGSLRVHRYHAMMLEAMEKYDEALELVDSLISHDETNAAPRKRRIAIFKAKGKTPEAIKELTDYLKKFMSDAEAWQELCELYLSQGEYSKAVFCAEELLLHQPHSHLFHQRVADIRYTMGGMDNMELAKTYYCQAAKLNPNNIRAFYGIFLVCNNLIAQSKSGGPSKKKELSQLSSWALGSIKEKYQNSGQNLPMLQGPKTGENAVNPLDAVVSSLGALAIQ